MLQHISVYIDCLTVNVSLNTSLFIFLNVAIRLVFKVCISL